MSYDIINVRLDIYILEIERWYCSAQLFSQ
jgi:hypothetical protein